MTGHVEYVDPEDASQLGDAAMRHARTVLQGRSRATTLKVLSVICDLAFKHGARTIICDVRTLAMGAGCSHSTAALAIQRLIDANILTDAGRTKEKARMCRFADHPPAHGDILDGADNDVWRHTGLGATGLLIWTALNRSTQPLSTKAVARQATVSPQTARRRLPQLEIRGLAHHTDDGWTQGTMNPADVLEPQANGASRQQRARYATQRAHWRNPQGRTAAPQHHTG